MTQKYFIQWHEKQYKEWYHSSGVSDKHPFLYIKELQVFLDSQSYNQGEVILIGWQEITDKEYKLYKDLDSGE